MAAAADIESYPTRSQKGDRVSSIMHVDIGGTGAPTVSAKDDASYTITRTGAGEYSLTFPACKLAVVRVDVVSPAATVVAAYLLTLAATAGTATFVTHDAATPSAADPASGDDLIISFDLDVSVLV
jgi:L-lactate utilization protein LutB